MTKVSAYPLATSIELADLFYILQGGVSKRANLGLPLKLAQVTITMSAVVDGVTITGTAVWGSQQNMSISGNAATATNAGHATVADTVTTNANLTGPITSVGNATAVASQTGTGSKFVMDQSPTLVTPNIGNATGSVSGNAGTATKLATARNINGVAFDGSADITAPAVLG